MRLLPVTGARGVPRRTDAPHVAGEAVAVHLIEEDLRGHVVGGPAGRLNRTHAPALPPLLQHHLKTDPKINPA